uniref:krev interaction trapped protein 1 isoform X2 n=1 Tax=Myxine glutinosa TaxID=7769 RepID=UPI00358F0CA9
MNELVVNEASELFAAVIRPKKVTSPASVEYHAKSYEILLCENEVQPGDRERQKKMLLCTRFSGDGDAGRVILDYVFEMTKHMSPINQGLRGKRSVLVKKFKTEGEKKEVLLYIVPTTTKGTDNARLVYSPTSPNFCCLHDVLHMCNEPNSQLCSPMTSMLLTLDRWLAEQHAVPLAIVALFRPSALERVKMCVSSPAYPSLAEGDCAVQEAIQEARRCMQELEKPEICLVNPLFGSDLQYTSQVDKVVMNPYFGMGAPDYGRILLTRSCGYNLGLGSNGSEGKERSWLEEFPLHHGACKGDVQLVQQLLEEGYLAEQNDRDLWTPLHYACWYGHLEATHTLLEQGHCDPNVPTGQHRVPLHFAASCGHVDLVQLLLDHPDIDRFAKDDQGCTPLQFCTENKQGQWEDVVAALQKSVGKPFEKLRVYREDGSYRAVELPHGSSTTVQDVLAALHLPASQYPYFALWICSTSLSLQLKPSHKPLQQLREWGKVIEELVPVPSQDESPELLLRRNVCLCLDKEKQVEEPAAIEVLFEEARGNLLKGMYPCSSQETVRLSALLLLINYGEYDGHKHKHGFLTEEDLKLILPCYKLKQKSHTTWINRVLHEYKQSRAEGLIKDRHALQQRFLGACWEFPTYGAAFFSGHIYTRSGSAGHKAVSVHIGVNCMGLQLLAVETKVLLLNLTHEQMDWVLSIREPCVHIHRLEDKMNYAIYTRQAVIIGKLMDKLFSKTQ